MKTTNAKAKAFQTPAGPAPDKEIQKTQAKQTSARRPKPKVSHADTIKLDIHGDDGGPLEEREVEYCPPKPKDIPYESEDFPDGCLDYDILKAPNMMRGWHSYYHNPVDENGVSLREKKFEKELERVRRETDERVLKALEEEDWTIGDVPEISEHLRLPRDDVRLKDKTNQPSKRSAALVSKGPATVTSRTAASALSMLPREPVLQSKNTNRRVAPKASTSFLARGKKPATPAPVNPSTMRHTVAAAASRSTIGYTKGRNASSVLNMRTAGLLRSTSNLSNASDRTITPASYAQQQGSDSVREDWRRLQFLGAFDTDDEDLEPALRGVAPDFLMKEEDAEEDFVLTLTGV
jgi:hypothetical protein